jgi:lipid-binding SYLF domain-containing protein
VAPGASRRARLPTPRYGVAQDKGVGTTDLLQGNIMALRRLGLAAVLLSSGGFALAQDVDSEALERRQSIDQNAQSTLDKLFAERADAKALYDRAVGYAVFTATKAGFIVSGGSGTGVAVDKASGQRTYMRMGTGGIGFGIGAQRYDMIILFEDEAILGRFVQGGWDSSATAQAAAGQEGVAVRSSFIQGVAFYQLTEKGLMAHADVSGTRFWVIDDLN